MRRVAVVLRSNLAWSGAARWTHRLKRWSILQIAKGHSGTRLTSRLSGLTTGQLLRHLMDKQSKLNKTSITRRDGKRLRWAKNIVRQFQTKYQCCYRGDMTP